MNNIHKTDGSTIMSEPINPSEIASMIADLQNQSTNESESRSPGEYIVDAYHAYMKDPNTTNDTPLVVPPSIVGKLARYIDRPLVNILGTQPGSSIREECIFGGYINVSRKFFDPYKLDIIANDLASQYGVETEVATAQAITAASCTTIGYGTDPTAVAISQALWQAAGKVCIASGGHGRLILAVAPDTSDIFQSLLDPDGTGEISGILLVTTAGFLPGKAFLLSTPAMKIREQRPGALNIYEPSASGLQLFYGNHFDPVVAEASAIVELVST